MLMHMLAGDGAPETGALIAAMVDAGGASLACDAELALLRCAKLGARGEASPLTLCGAALRSAPTHSTPCTPLCWTCPYPTPPCSMSITRLKWQEPGPAGRCSCSHHGCAALAPSCPQKGGRRLTAGRRLRIIDHSQPGFGLCRQA